MFKKTTPFAAANAADDIAGYCGLTITEPSPHRFVLTDGYKRNFGLVLTFDPAWYMRGFVLVNGIWPQYDAECMTPRDFGYHGTNPQVFRVNQLILGNKVYDRFFRPYKRAWTSFYAAVLTSVSRQIIEVLPCR